MKNKTLDAVTKAKTAYVTAKASLEAKLREQLRQEMSNLQTQIDVAVRIAYNSGESKAEIMRALGTKDYHTINGCLARTEGVEEVRGTDPLDEVYSYEDGVLSVRYDKHGPRELTGEAEFKVQQMEDNSIMFLAITPLYSEDYSERNYVAMALDQKFDGFYHEEAVEWVREKL